MTDMTSAVKQPSLTNPLAPVYTQCTAADKFLPGAGDYMLHYKNGATAQAGSIFLSEQKATAPAGSIPAVSGAPSTKWSDAKISVGVGASAELTVWITAAQLANYVDTNGFVNLLHGGTLTTLTLAIFGPF